jgi:hypothetical protein
MKGFKIVSKLGVVSKNVVTVVEGGHNLIRPEGAHG